MLSVRWYLVLQIFLNCRMNDFITTSNSNCGKVVFSQACADISVHRRVCIQAYNGQGGVHPQADTQ